jgi:hypothetical protein
LPSISINNQNPVSSLLLRQSINADGSLVHSPLVESEVSKQLDPEQKGMFSDLSLSDRDLKLIAIGMIEAREAAAKVADKWYDRGGGPACRHVASEIRRG